MLKSTKQLIKEFVCDNYGQSELENPSWNIEELANYIDNESKGNRTLIGTVGVDSGTITIADMCNWTEKLNWNSFCDEVAGQRYTQHEPYSRGLTIWTDDDGEFAVYAECGGKRIVIELE